MPHLQIQYSRSLDERIDMGHLCRLLAEEIASIGLYPLGGIRVRAFATDHEAVADLHPRNSFVDLVFRIGAGRSPQEKKDTGDRLIKISEEFFKDELQSGYFMLALEIVEIDNTFSWKVNSVHGRLKKEKNKLPNEG